MRRVVITGIGIVSSLGIGRESFWRSLTRGHRARSIPKHFDIRPYRAPFTSTVDYDAVMRTRENAGIDACQHLCADIGLLAAREALQHALIDTETGHLTIGLSIGTTSGGCADEYLRWLFFNEERKSRTLNCFSVSSATDQIAASLNLRGPVCTFSSACTSSTISIIHASELIRNGDVDLMIAGGCDVLREIDYAGFNSLRVLSIDDIRPFDLNRKGMIIGDGAAMLVLEEYNHAKSRCADVLAEIKSNGMSCDAHHMTAPNSLGAVAAMRSALDQAILQPQDIQYVNCHGTGTMMNDKAEAVAIQNFFGPHAGNIYATSTKSSTGHLLGSTGSLEVSITALVVFHQLIPPMPSLQTPDPIVPFKIVQHEALNTSVEYAISNSFGFGGNNASIVIGRCE